MHGDVDMTQQWAPTIMVTDVRAAPQGRRGRGALGMRVGGKGDWWARRPGGVLWTHAWLSELDLWGKREEEG